MQDGYPIDGDALYCSGHAPLQDGRVLYVGGARYANISSPFEREWGLDYARIYNPKTNTISLVKDKDGNVFKMPLGRSWYPTASRTIDGRVIITGGFTDYGTDLCVGK